MEVDAIFFLESAEKNTLAVHVEMEAVTARNYLLDKPKPIGLGPRAFVTNAASERHSCLTITSLSFSFVASGQLILKSGNISIV